MKIQTGLERLLESPPRALSGGAPYGLLAHQASVDRSLRYAPEQIADRCPNLKALFSPQHGIWGTEQANMIETGHSTDPITGAVVHSLYSEVRRPTPEMLDGLEWFVIDLQDVGTRVYTYIWTVVQCLQACADAGIRVLILDRPNPIGGKVVEGPLLEADFTSFVGMACIPMRHALTLGELASFCNDALGLGANIDIVAMKGWNRAMYFEETELPWVPPSPNMPRVSTALVYPGQVLLEGINLSEGRGTTIPFEVVGAPFIDSRLLASALSESFRAYGIKLRPTSFQPTFDKWKGQTCHGVAWHWTNVQDVRSYAATITLIKTIKHMWPDETQWLPPPYEYEYVKPPIDILTGSDKFRLWLDQTVASSTEDGQHQQVPDALLSVEADRWWATVSPHLLYD